MSILNILSMLKSPTVKTNLLAQLSDSLTVEVSKKIQLENSLSNLGSWH